MAPSLDIHLSITQCTKETITVVDVGISLPSTVTQLLLPCSKFLECSFFFFLSGGCRGRFVFPIRVCFIKEEIYLSSSSLYQAQCLEQGGYLTINFYWIHKIRKPKMYLEVANQWFSKCGLSNSSLWELIRKIQNLRSYPKSTISKTLGMGPKSLFSQALWTSLMPLKF